MAVALGTFALKEIPVWFLPVITASIIDIVAQHGDPMAVVGWFLLAFLLLAQNYPNSMLYTRRFMTVVRDTARDLRNGLAARLQSLSIGYHSRVSAALVQSKVVRDVENVELMMQQATPPILSAVIVLIGATTMTAITVPAFLPVYALTIPLALLLRVAMRRRSRSRNEEFRQQMEGLAARVGEMASLIPVTRAHGLEQTAVNRVASRAEGVRRAGLHLDILNSRVSAVSWVTMQLLGVGCLVAAALLALHVFGISPGEWWRRPPNSSSHSIRRTFARQPKRQRDC